MSSGTPTPSSEAVPKILVRREPVPSTIVVLCAPPFITVRLDAVPKMALTGDATRPRPRATDVPLALPTVAAMERLTPTTVLVPAAPPDVAAMERPTAVTLDDPLALPTVATILFVTPVAVLEPTDRPTVDPLP